MELFTELMKVDAIKRSVLNEFGFETVNNLEVVKWIKEKYPVDYYDIKKNIESKNEIESGEIEITPVEEMKSILDQGENHLDVQREWGKELINKSNGLSNDLINCATEYTDEIVENKKPVLTNSIDHLNKNNKDNNKDLGGGNVAISKERYDNLLKMEEHVGTIEKILDGKIGLSEGNLASFEFKLLLELLKYLLNNLKIDLKYS